MGPKVVAPLRNAMRLVHGDERDPAAGQRLAKGGYRKALGCNQQELQAAVRDVVQRFLPGWRVLRRVEKRRADAGLLGPPYLILHERDQWTENERQPRKHKRWNLVTDALASSRREHAQRVTALECGPDQRFLTRAEVGVAEAFREEPAGLGDVGWHRPRCGQLRGGSIAGRRRARATP